MVALAGVTSAAVKSVTGALKVAVTWMTEALLGSGAAESSVTVGPVRVTVRLKVSAAVLGLPAASAAAPAAMPALTVPSPAGTRSNVYPLGDTVATFSSVALVGVMSAALKPLTGSLKVTVTGI